jgi:hypothetical protein
MIQQMELHEVALADADEAARHIAAERPEDILDAVGEALGASMTSRFTTTFVACVRLIGGGTNGAWVSKTAATVRQNRAAAERKRVSIRSSRSWLSPRSSSLPIDPRWTNRF